MFCGFIKQFLMQMSLVLVKVTDLCPRTQGGSRFFIVNVQIFNITYFPQHFESSQRLKYKREHHEKHICVLLKAKKPKKPATKSFLHLLQAEMGDPMEMEFQIGSCQTGTLCYMPFPFLIYLICFCCIGYLIQEYYVQTNNWAKLHITV